MIHSLACQCRAYRAKYRCLALTCSTPNASFGCPLTGSCRLSKSLQFRQVPWPKILVQDMIRAISAVRKGVDVPASAPKPIVIGVHLACFSLMPTKLRHRTWRHRRGAENGIVRGHLQKPSESTASLQPGYAVWPPSQRAGSRIQKEFEVQACEQDCLCSS